jgi:hypothetical protein
MNSRADGVSTASRCRTIEIIRRTFHPRNRTTPSVPARSSPSTVNSLQPATPWPGRWLANPYAGSGPVVTLEHDLQRLHATGSGIGYLAYGADVDAQLRRIDGTSYFYRDGSELMEEQETFEELTRP